MRSRQYTRRSDLSHRRVTNTLYSLNPRKPAARFGNHSKKPMCSIEIRAAQVNLTRCSVPLGHSVLLAVR
jgi:hypothetical protein